LTGPDLSRRTVLAAAGGAALAGTGVTAVQPARATPSGKRSGRPNIVWFLSEDNNPYLGSYGDRVADTPALDKLAAEGARYDVMYSPAPVCAPSRFTYLTGMHAESCGPAHHMRAIAKMPVEFRGFPEYLRNNGYYATNNAKTDYNANVDLAATWNESSPTAHWRNRPVDTPFFAQFTDFTTHESQLFGAVDGATDPADVRVPTFLPDTATVRADHAHYYDLMHTMDTHVAARIAELEADGVLDDTIIFYFGDNGGVLPFSKRFAGERGNRCTGGRRRSAADRTPPHRDDDPRSLPRKALSGPGSPSAPLHLRPAQSDG
jgi:arylsulfatase A-like enzyme